MPNQIQAHRIALLARKSEVLFHLKDLANLWQIKQAQTLRITIKRYCDAGLLYRIYRGFYATRPLTELDPQVLGAKALHTYCYLSTESILFATGYLSQKPQALSFVSARRKTIQIGEQLILSRQLKTAFLYNSEGVEESDGVKKATPERAVADLLYFNPLAHFDKKVDWNRVRALQKKIGYPLTPKRYVAS
ncbi:hypothetical protein IPG41_06110 [Candidatus Peregrinibacteria bacterium]|nr:MAG: hypothetical protein IPG41_06110 [Candidatus Peregrinibacteria bacterium]